MSENKMEKFHLRENTMRKSKKLDMEIIQTI